MSNTERLEQIQGEINAYKILLNDTDYSLYRLVENLTECKTLEDMKSAFDTYLDKYGATVEQRREWRRRINELEAEAEKIEPDEELVPEETEAEPEQPGSDDATPGDDEEQEGTSTEEEVIVDEPEAEPDGE